MSPKPQLTLNLQKDGESCEHQELSPHDINRESYATDAPLLVSSRRLEDNELELLGTRTNSLQAKREALIDTIEESMEDILHSAIHYQQSIFERLAQQPDLPHERRAELFLLYHSRQYLRSHPTVIRIPGTAKETFREAIRTGAYIIAGSYLLQDPDTGGLSLEVIRFLPQTLGRLEQEIEKQRMHRSRLLFKNELTALADRGEGHALHLQHKLMEWLYTQKLDELKDSTIPSFRKFHDERLKPYKPIAATVEIAFQPCLSFCFTLAAKEPENFLPSRAEIPRRYD